MIMQERLQAAIHMLEVGFGVRIIRWLMISVILLALALLYDTRAYHNFDSPEAMDSAQLARNIAEGRGYTTEFVRPFSLYLIQKHNRAMHLADFASTNFVDAAQIYVPHPDIANAPLYPMVLAGLLKAWTPQWKLELHKSFWSDGGTFQRYGPEFEIALLNQLLLIIAVWLTFLIARKLFDPETAWMAALLMLGSDLLWKFSVSGLSTPLLIVIFLGLIRCLVQVEELGRAGQPDIRRSFLMAVVAGGLTGLGMLTCYSFGWVIVPVIVFLLLFGGSRRAGQAIMCGLIFVLVVTPWVLRNFSISGTFFGTAGYACIEGTGMFPGSKLMQSVNPELDSTMRNWLPIFARKFLENFHQIFQGDLLRLAGGWPAILFYAGLLLGLRGEGARRMRYFTLICMALFVLIEALGRTQLAYISPEINTENLLALLTPLVMIFAAACSLALINLMNLPSPQARIGLVGLIVVLTCQPLISTLLPPANGPVTYKNPTDLQKIAGWIRPEELMMSDIPWAVAWYGDRQCAWTTVNSRYEFYLLHDYIKPVRGLYLSTKIIDGKILSDCINGPTDNWTSFAFDLLTNAKKPVDNMGRISMNDTGYGSRQTRFPLLNSPSGGLNSGLFLADRQRW